MTTKNEAPAVTFLDNPHAPEVFAVEAVGFLNHLGNIHITFATPRVNHVTAPGPVNRVVVGRVVMPILGAQTLLTGLADFMRRQGIDPTPPAEVAPPSATLQ